MRKSFPGHFPPSKHEADNLWNTCLFAVDANILLNLYRYSDATRKEFLGILKAIEDRLWLPYRAAQEYFENRLIVIAQQETAYEQAIKTIGTLQADLSNTRQHPFLTDKLMHKLSGVLEEVRQELHATKAIHSKRTTTDEIQEAIGNLFKERVGLPFSEEQLETISKEGEQRYARKIPPGYKDDGKNETDNDYGKYRKYGDLLIWQQIIDSADKAKKGVIFVNDDKKEDWWLIRSGKTLGPRPELIAEFLGKTGQAFYMYQADRFLEFAAAHLKQNVAPESVSEVRDLMQHDIQQIADGAALLRGKASRFRESEAILDAGALEAIKRMGSKQPRHAFPQAADRILQRLGLDQDRLTGSNGEDNENSDPPLKCGNIADLVEQETERLRQHIAKTEEDHLARQALLSLIDQLKEKQFENEFAQAWFAGLRERK